MRAARNVRGPPGPQAAPPRAVPVASSRSARRACRPADPAAASSPATTRGPAPRAVAARGHRSAVTESWFISATSMAALRCAAPLVRVAAWAAAASAARAAWAAAASAAPAARAARARAPEPAARVVRRAPIEARSPAGLARRHPLRLRASQPSRRSRRCSARRITIARGACVRAGSRPALCRRSPFNLSVSGSSPPLPGEQRVQLRAASRRA